MPDRHLDKMIEGRDAAIARRAAEAAERAEQDRRDLELNASWLAAYTDAPLFTETVAAEITRRLLHLAEMIRERFWDFYIADLLATGEEKVSLLRLSRTAARMHCRFQGEAVHDPLGPRSIAKRPTALDALPQGLQLGVRLRRVYVCRPTWFPRQRPSGQQRSVFGRAALPTKQAAPAPLLGSTHQFGPQGVPLDVPRHGVKMAVLLNGERLEASLVDVPRTG
jgi:hypothetical protein